jgi:hypothetical protein
LPNNRTQNQSETFSIQYVAKPKQQIYNKEATWMQIITYKKSKHFLNFRLETNSTKNTMCAIDIFVKLQTQQEIKHWNRK